MRAHLNPEVKKGKTCDSNHSSTLPTVIAHIVFYVTTEHSESHHNQLHSSSNTRASKCLMLKRKERGLWFQTRKNITINLHTQNSESSPSLRYFTFVDKTLFIPVLPPPFSLHLSPFSSPSLTNYPSPCVRNCMHIENLDCESSQMFSWRSVLQRFAAEHKVHSLTRSSHIWKCLHQAKQKLLWGRSHSGPQD